MINKLVIIGVSETAERILRFCEFYQLYDVVGFAVDARYRKSSTFYGKPVWDLEALDLHIDRKEVFVFIALFWNHLNGDRRRLYERVCKLGFQFANIISPKASIRGSVGVNCWVMDYSVVQEGAVIENNVILADNALIGHLSHVESHCFIGAKSTIMGGCTIGEQAFVGVGATVFENLCIGKKSIIGACTIAKQDIPDFSVLRINDPNVICKQYTEQEMESKMVANFRR